MIRLPEPRPSVRPQKAWLLLALLLVAAGALRCWYGGSNLFLTRFEDERYSLQNVRKIYFTGDLEPASGYYPSPVFNLPQVALLKAADAVHRHTGDPAWRVVDDRGKFYPRAFLLTRALSTFWGLVALVAIFLCGRRLFSARVGLLAALLLAFLPWMIHASGYNKPDALLVAAVLLAIHGSLAAADGLRARWYVWTGAAIALAMSAKLTGGLVAVPLMVLTALTARREPKRLAYLALAGATSAALFVLANPYWRAYLHFIQGLKRDYAGRTESGPWHIPLEALGFHLDGYLFGGVFGALALLAWGLFGLSLVLRSGDSGESGAGGLGLRRVQGILLASFPVVYTAAYALQTSYYKANNFLPVAVLAALPLAWLLDALWRRASPKIPAGLRRPAAALAVLALVVATVPRGWSYVYRSLVVTTQDAALLYLDHQLEPASGRLVYLEAWDGPLPPWEGVRRFQKGLSAVKRVEDVGSLDAETRALADALVVRADLPGRDAAALDAWAAEPGTEVRRFAAEPFAMRGPEFIAIDRRWRRAGPPDLLGVSGCGAGCLSAELPETAQPGDRFTVFLRLPSSLLDGADPPRLLAGDEDVELVWLSHSRRGHLLVSRRAELGPDVGALRLVRGPAFGPGEDDVVFQLERWRSPQQGSVAPAQER